ncbi:hypothetical protein ISS05_04610 [Candidatus Woesearchaeota archaeon]|nr:hypothetical protein [Candidatus Woesearchaeota archaeon]
MLEKKVGQYAFVVGIIIAVVLGLAIPALTTATHWLISLLIVLGIIVGFLNITGKETKEFLMVGVTLVLLSYAGGAGTAFSGIMYVGIYLQGIFQGILAFIIPAVVIVGLKDIWRIAKGA